jgi:hypothetical protein
MSGMIPLGAKATYLFFIIVAKYNIALNRLISIVLLTILHFYSRILIADEFLINHLLRYLLLVVN